MREESEVNQEAKCHTTCIGKIRGKQVFPVGKERSDKSSEREEERKARGILFFSRARSELLMDVRHVYRA